MSDTADIPQVAPPPAADIVKLAQSSNAFGFDLYQRLRQNPGNLVISPAEHHDGSHHDLGRCPRGNGGADEEGSLSGGNA